jgi:hypothetical protein
MVGAEGFEPPTLCSQSRCATRLRYAPMTCFIVARRGLPISLAHKLSRQLTTSRAGTGPVGSWTGLSRALFWIRLGGTRGAFGRGSATTAAVEPGKGEVEAV